MFCIHSSSSQYFSGLKVYTIFLLTFILRKIGYSTPLALITLSSVEVAFFPNILFELAWLHYVMFSFLVTYNLQFSSSCWKSSMDLVYL